MIISKLLTWLRTALSLKKVKPAVEDQIRDMCVELIKRKEKWFNGMDLMALTPVTPVLIHNMP